MTDKEIIDTFRLCAHGRCKECGRDIQQCEKIYKGAYELLVRLKADDAPAVDVVEVVRCKDCALYGLAHCPLSIIENRELIFINHDPEFYCGCGERKEK